MKNPTTLAAANLNAAFVAVGGLVKYASEPAFVSRVEHQQQMQQAELRQRFEQAVVMLHARQYDHAITALHRVLELAQLRLLHLLLVLRTAHEGRLGGVFHQAAHRHEGGDQDGGGEGGGMFHAAFRRRPCAERGSRRERRRR